MGSQTSGSAKKASRRSFIGGSVGIAATGALAPTLAAYADRRRRGKNRKSDVSPYGPLFPKKDATTGLPLLKLPRGFRYASVGWTGILLATSAAAGPESSWQLQQRIPIRLRRLDRRRHV